MGVLVGIVVGALAIGVAAAAIAVGVWINTMYEKGKEDDTRYMENRRNWNKGIAHTIYMRGRTAAMNAKAEQEYKQDLNMRREKAIRDALEDLAKK